ncbi:MAG: translation initiation factor IF-1 [Chlamydiia bacterium]|nr:translation initiation factor IF-1 [Chlamydiia bacterium]
MSGDDLVKVEGIVVDTLPSLTFKVELLNGNFAITTLCGKMRRTRRESLRVMKGDKVLLEMSIHDLTMGRIVYRFPRK